MRLCLECSTARISPIELLILQSALALLQPLDVPPFAWHAVTTAYITGLPHAADGHHAIAVELRSAV